MSEKKGNVAEKGEDGAFTIVAPHVLDFAFGGQVQCPQFRLSSQVRQFEMRALHRQQEASAASLVSLPNRQEERRTSKTTTHAPDQFFPPRILALNDFVLLLPARYKPVRGARGKRSGRSRAILCWTKRAGNVHVSPSEPGLIR